MSGLIAFRNWNTSARKIAPTEMSITTASSREALDLLLVLAADLQSVAGRQRRARTRRCCGSRRAQHLRRQRARAPGSAETVMVRNWLRRRIFSVCIA